MRLESFAGIHASNWTNYQSQEEVYYYNATCRAEHKLDSPEVEDHDPAADNEKIEACH